jgi:predicted Kef-type K+ transport protein
MRRILDSARYLRALATVVRRSAIPYGYAITIWTAGAVIEHGHGTPNLGQAYLFLVGAVAGFIAVALLASRATPDRLEPASGGLLRTGAINALALGLALGAAALVAMIPGTGAWPAGSFASTAVYLLVAGAELAIADRDKGCPPSADH